MIEAATFPDPTFDVDQILTVDDDEWLEFYSSLTPQQIQQIEASVRSAPRVAPQPGPQTQAFVTPARVIGYGGDLHYKELIATPCGWKEHGDIGLLDSICDIDGNASIVVGRQDYLNDLYRVIFDDGTESKCGPNHLWAVWMPSFGWRWREVLPLWYIIDKMNCGIEYCVPLADPVVQVLREGQGDAFRKPERYLLSCKSKKIKKIEKIPGKHETNCIQTSHHTGTYITNNHTVTHNSAGGGKSGLICLLCLLEHERSVIFRKDAKQIAQMIDDLVQFYGSVEGLNRQMGVFRYIDSPNHYTMWGGLDKPGEEMNWRGRAFDLQAYDECTEIQREKIVFLSTWNRTTTPGQRCRRVLTFNPPGGPDDLEGDKGRWVIDYFRPWLDERHTDPAAPNEIRYFYTVTEDGEECDEESRVATPRAVNIKGYKTTQIPESRVFIPASLKDNRFLEETGYEQSLLQLPEELRDRMLLGEFRSGMRDAEYQLIPTAWVDEAMDRWVPEGRLNDMDALGVDVSRGGKSATTLAPRHGFFIDSLIQRTGIQTSTGGKVATFVLDNVRDMATVNIDVLGVGASPYDDLIKILGKRRVLAVDGRQRQGLPKLELSVKMFNMRTALYWMLRKILDPSNGFEAMLPPDNALRAEIISHQYDPDPPSGTIKVWDKTKVRDKTGYSPDRSDAVVYSLFNAMLTQGGERLKARRAGNRVDTSRLYKKNPFHRERHGWMAR